MRHRPPRDNSPRRHVALLSSSSHPGLGARRLTAACGSYFLDEGTLLGAVRGGDIIHCDADIDLGVLVSIALDAKMELALKQARGWRGGTAVLRADRPSRWQPSADILA